MKVALTLEGQRDKVSTLVSLAVSEGILVEYHQIEAPARPGSHGTTAPSLKVGDRVSKKFQTKTHSNIKRHSTGTVKQIRNQGRGTGALVEWDDESIESDWITISHLAKV